MSSVKLIQNSQTNKVTNLADMENGILSNGKINPQLCKTYRLSIQIDKVYSKPCPKSKKKYVKGVIDSQSTDSQSESQEGKSSNKYTKVREEKQSNQCLVCQKKFTVISELFKHLKEHFTCDICKTEFNSRKSYEKHRELHESKVKPFPYKCDICSIIFQTLEEVKRHNHVINITIDNYDNTEENKIQYCKDCNMTFRNEFTYRKHLHSHAAKISASQLHLPVVNIMNPTIGHLRPVTFSCKVCSATFATICEIDLHTKSHLEKQQ